MSLSIYIPTFNRAPKLAVCLASLVPQVNATEGVDIVISDNHSTDNTPAVVEHWQNQCSKIRYIRNDRNLGIIQNIVNAWHHVTADFCWTVGDDEIFTPYAIDTAMKALTTSPSVGFCFFNSMSLLEDDRPMFEPDKITSDDVSSITEPLLQQKLQANAKRVSSQPNVMQVPLESLVNPAVDGIYLGSLMVCIFRTELLRGCVADGEVHDTPFRDALNSYPHTVAFSRCLIGQQAIHLPMPGTMNFWGQRDWGKAIPVLLVCRLTELVETWIAAGIPQSMHQPLRQHQIRRAMTMVNQFFQPGSTGLDTFDPAFFETHYATTFPHEVKRIMAAWEAVSDQSL